MASLLSSLFAFTPYRAILLQLLLIGIPYRFGLLPTGWFRGWLIPDTTLGDKCTIFYNNSSNYDDGGGEENPQSRCTAFEGEEIIDKMHASEGRVHEGGRIDLSDVGDYLEKRRFGVERHRDKFQKVLLAYRRIV